MGIIWLLFTSVIHPLNTRVAAPDETSQLVRAMPDLLVVHKVNKTTRLTRIYPAPPLIPLLKAKCASPSPPALPHCQADKSAVATVSYTKEVNKRYGVYAKRELFRQFWKPSSVRAALF